MPINEEFFGNLALIALTIIVGVPLVYYVTRVFYAMWRDMVRDFQDWRRRQNESKSH
jgi:hypothetical protein